MASREGRLNQSSTAAGREATLVRVHLPVSASTPVRFAASIDALCRQSQSYHHTVPISCLSSSSQRHYLAPELWLAAQPGLASDVFSFGIAVLRFLGYSQQCVPLAVLRDDKPFIRSHIRALVAECQDSIKRAIQWIEQSQ